MTEITIYVPTDPKVELPEKQYDSTTSGHYSLITESNMNCTGWYYHKNHKWILDGYDSLPIKEWLKPVTISEKEINQAIELLLAAHLTLIDENRRDGSWPQKHIARKSFDEKKQAILALMRGEK